MNTSNMVFLDMDGVLADFRGLMNTRYPETLQYKDFSPEVNEIADKCQATVGFYRDLPTIDGAIEAYHMLREKYDVWILSAPSWDNPHSYSEKREWVTNHLGDSVFKKLILSNNKGIFTGRALIDDRTKYGADQFGGEHIHFGQEKFPDWDSVTNYLL
jgi:5'-nucleotidase